MTAVLMLFTVAFSNAETVMGVLRDGIAFVVNRPVAQHAHHRLRIGEGDGEQHEYGGQAFDHDLGFSSSSEIPVSASYPVFQASFSGRHSPLCCSLLPG